MSILSEITVTVAPPYSCRREKGSEVEFIKPTDKLKPYDPTSDYIYYDENGKTIEESNKILKVVTLLDVVKGIQSNPTITKRCNVLRKFMSLEMDEELKKKHQSHIKLMGLHRLYWGSYELKENEKGKLKFTDAGLIKHSGVLCFDVDNLNEKDLEFLKEYIQKDKHTLVGFLSPRGNGYKWLVRVPPIIENHKLYYESLVDYYNSLWLGYFKLDMSCINPSRTCFASFDDNIYINEDSKIWITKKEIQPIKSTDKKIYVHSSAKQIFEKCINRVENGIRKSGPVEKIAWVDGSKHVFLVAVAGMCKAMGMSHEDFCIVGKDLLIDKLAEKDVKQVFNKK